MGSHKNSGRKEAPRKSCNARQDAASMRNQGLQNPRLGDHRGFRRPPRGWRTRGKPGLATRDTDWLSRRHSFPASPLTSVSTTIVSVLEINAHARASTSVKAGLSRPAFRTNQEGHVIRCSGRWSFLSCSSSIARAINEDHVRTWKRVTSTMSTLDRTT